MRSDGGNAFPLETHTFRHEPTELEAVLAVFEFVRRSQMTPELRAIEDKITADIERQMFFGAGPH